MPGEAFRRPAVASTCLLASYPKSGNTWLRALLTGLGESSVELASLVGVDRMALPREVEAFLGLDPVMLAIDQLDEVRAEMLRSEYHGGGPVWFEKTHLANRALPSGRRLADAACGRAVYVVRHPFDVVVSYAHFIAADLDAVIEQLENVDAVLDRPGASRPGLLPQFMSSWARHVMSWTFEPPLPVLVLRYEDISADAEQQLARVADFVRSSASPATIKNAVEASRFHRLSEQESRHGFNLSTSATDRFFRSGRVGEGMTVLNATQRWRIVESCGGVMKRLGYEPDGGVGTIQL